MPNIIEGQSKLNKEGKFAIVVSKFNSFVTEKLLEGCLQTLKANSAQEKNIDIIKVPGAFEIPTACKYLIDLNKYNALICLGCVIRGETPHFDYICNSVSSEIARLGSTYGVPVIFGIVTAENIEQAIERAGGKIVNRGSEAALTAMEMVNLIKEVKSERLKI